jgi:hypothetical protein
VVKDLNGYKDLGLDSFSMTFFWSCWDVTEVDVRKVFLEFQSSYRAAYRVSPNPPI